MFAIEAATADVTLQQPGQHVEKSVFPGRIQQYHRATCVQANLIGDSPIPSKNSVVQSPSGATARSVRSTAIEGLPKAGPEGPQ